MTRPAVAGLHPQLFVEDASAAVEFYRRAFGAIEVFRNALPDGRLLFVELAVGPARLLLSDPFPDLGADPPAPDADPPLLLHLEVEEPDDVARRAVVLGATVEMAVEEQFWGERYGILRDPFGFRWSISTARQALSLDEVTARTPSDVAGDADLGTD